MTFDFWADRTDKRVRYSEFNNFALTNKNFLISGCTVTAAGTDMDVDVASGKVFIDGDVVEVSSGSITLTSSCPFATSVLSVSRASFSLDEIGIIIAPYKCLVFGNLLASWPVDWLASCLLAC